MYVTVRSQMGLIMDLMKNSKLIKEQSELSTLELEKLPYLTNLLANIDQSASVLVTVYMTFGSQMSFIRVQSDQNNQSYLPLNLEKIC